MDATIGLDTRQGREVAPRMAWTDPQSVHAMRGETSLPALLGGFAGEVHGFGRRQILPRNSRRKIGQVADIDAAAWPTCRQTGRL